MALPSRGPTPATWPAWLAAAAGVALAIGGWTWALTRPPTVIVRTEVAPPPSATPPAPAPIVSAASPIDERAKLLAQAKDARVVPWKTTKDPAGHGASGDVVWSAAEQKGFMRFVGLEPNDKTRAQYQLWIFDKDRDAHYPVDGGVFDVPSSGEVVVPITARLYVNEATLFAVTVEKPGGVVVSKRTRIGVAASPAHFHPYSFSALRVIDQQADEITVRVAYRVLGPLGVEVDARFHCADPRTIAMTIVRGEGEGSVVETHATPIGPGRTAILEATLASSDPPGFRAARHVAPLLRPLLRWASRRLWADDASYAERLYELRSGLDEVPR